MTQADRLTNAELLKLYEDCIRTDELLLNLAPLDADGIARIKWRRDLVTSLTIDQWGVGSRSDAERL